MSRLYGFALCLLILACTSGKTNENAYAQSALIHNSMIRKANEMEHAIREMMKDSLPLSEGGSLRSILTDLQEWKEQLVEVPGNEIHDHKSHGHHDQNQSDVTPEQMLLIQKELDSYLGKIGKRLNHFSNNKKQ